MPTASGSTSNLESRRSRRCHNPESGPLKRTVCKTSRYQTDGGCLLSPYMKGRAGQGIALISEQRVCWRVSCAKARATKAPGSTLGDCPPKALALTPAACGASSSRTPLWSEEGSHHRIEGSDTVPLGSQPFIRRSPHMMGFGHVPLGSIRSSITPKDGGSRRSPSAQRSAAETHASCDWARFFTSPSRSA